MAHLFSLEKFFFEDEVMPIYREVTVPMEAHGVDLDMELIEKVHGEIIIDQKKNKEIVMKSLLEISEVKEWIMDTAFKEYPPSHKGNWAQRLAQRYSLNLPKSEKTGKYSITQKHVEALDDSPAKDYLMTYGISGKRISTISYGKEKPVNPGSDPLAWSQNRRSVTVKVN